MGAWTIHPMTSFPSSVIAYLLVLWGFPAFTIVEKENNERVLLLQNLCGTLATFPVD